ncbi:NAD(P)/FAD-dependent oxidoreductase [Micromonospora sp. WMMA1947]|uniref:NAD(P)/FAD-dependent oxidoreductase n=1 Tax=Micromonospora sp. WMMA1947 TaxID=3015163 RepID=UPI00248CE272|nr:NAD(P)/FAD-dependent oxidoreductase [Micromonospora sp. WMMA1947]WBC07481.1 NAD(P)/FAD-dependent oxidoreductase [Micromonospora sp. WMMA1947]
MYDVIVIGGRCAGSPLAMLLAQRGHRVLVLDRSHFPSDRLSTHYVQPSGLARLRRWGLLDQLAASGCPPIREARWWFDDTLVSGFAPPVDGIDMAYAPRRTVLDALLVGAARDRGVEVREGFTVRELLFDGDQVCGVRGRSAGGADETIRATVVVGADGRHSMVARAVGAESYDERPAYTVVYYTYWHGLSAHRRNRNEVFIHEDTQVGVIPTHDDAYLIQAARPHSFAATYRTDIEGHYRRAIRAAAPALDRELDGATRVSRFQGTAALQNYYRRPYGPGWALLGDAGFHKDPLTGQGISDAWRDAEALSAALHATLTGAQEWDQVMSEYERRRNAESAMMYDFTCEAASFEFDPMTKHLVQVLATSPEHANRFFGVIAGTVTPEDFFSPDSLLDMLGRLPEDTFADEGDLVG